MQVLDAGYDCSISAGIAETDAATELEEMLRRADEAMYRSKQRKASAAHML
jgi:PleD family two-component response regulator